MLSAGAELTGTRKDFRSYQVRFVSDRCHQRKSELREILCLVVGAPTAVAVFNKMVSRHGNASKSRGRSLSESVGIRNMAQLAIFSLVCFSLATAMHFLRLTVLHSTLVVSSLMLLSCSSLSASVRLQVNGETMGTYFSVTIDSPSTSDTEASVRAEIVVRLNEINAQMSTWDSQSEISGFNRSDSTSWFPVSAEFAAVVQEAKRIHEISEGAFDPTVSPLIDLWGFGKPDRLGVPVQAAIENALKTVGMHKIDVRNRPPALRKSLPEVQLNLSAIAKGYAVDAIARLLIRSGRPSFIVDIGGETRAGIAKASGDPWRIGVESPKSGLGRNEQPAQVIPVTESSIATSGDYRNFYEADGATYSHTINPSTGRPLENPPASVSVIHNFCMTADALATAMMVLGRERGIQIAEQQGYSVLFQTAAPGTRP